MKINIKFWYSATSKKSCFCLVWIIHFIDLGFVFRFMIHFELMSWFQIEWGLNGRCLFVCFFVILGIKSWTFNILSKHSAAELHPPHWAYLFVYKFPIASVTFVERFGVCFFSPLHLLCATRKKESFLDHLFGEGCFSHILLFPPWAIKTKHLVLYFN